MSMPDLEKMFKTAQSKQKEIETSLKEAAVEATAGGGLVSVKMDGLKRPVSVNIDPTLFKDSDREMLQDLIIVALNNAIEKVDNLVQQKMSQAIGLSNFGF